MSCLFCKIVRREIPASIVYEDDRVLAFSDINPQAPTHVLIVPKRHIETLNALEPGDDQIVGERTRGLNALDPAVDAGGLEQPDDDREAALAVHLAEDDDLVFVHLTDDDPAEFHVDRHGGLATVGRRRALGWTIKAVPGPGKRPGGTRALLRRTDAVYPS